MRKAWLGGQAFRFASNSILQDGAKLMGTEYVFWIYRVRRFGGLTGI
jgi:hypothetical protein